MIWPGPRTVAALAAAVRGKLWSYIRDGFLFWTAVNSVNFKWVSPGHRLLFAGVVGATWSTYLSWKTNRLE